LSFGLPPCGWVPSLGLQMVPAIITLAFSPAKDLTPDPDLVYQEAMVNFDE
jgi:hypothetical protein